MNLLDCVCKDEVTPDTIIHVEETQLGVSVDVVFEENDEQGWVNSRLLYLEEHPTFGTLYEAIKAGKELAAALGVKLRLA